MSNSVAYFYNKLNRALIRQKQLEKVYEAARECEGLDRFYIDEMIKSRFDTVVDVQLLDYIATHINRNKISREKLDWPDIQVHYIKYIEEMNRCVKTLGESSPVLKYERDAIDDMHRLDVGEAFVITSKWGRYYTIFSDKGSLSYFCIYGTEDKSWGMSNDYRRAEDALNYIKQNGADHGRFYKVIDGKGNLYAMGKTGRV